MRFTLILASLLIPAAWSVAAQDRDTFSVPTISLSGQSTAVGFEMEGVIQAVKQSVVSAQANGRIAELRVKAGDAVRAGQVLAIVDDREMQTGVQKSEALIAQTQAELRNAQAHLNRTRELRAQGFISQAALDTAEMQFKAAAAGMAQAEAGGRQSKLSKEFTRITAPFDGYILETSAQVGDLAYIGKPLLQLYAPVPLRAVVQVPASQAATVRSIRKAEVQVPGPSGTGTWLAPVRQQVLPVADPVSQTIEWRLDLAPHATAGGVPGQQVRVRFAAGEVQRLLVPQRAVVRRGELSAVYVAADKVFNLRPVRLGRDHGSAGVEVLAGIGTSDTIAVDGVRAGLQGARPGPAAAPDTR
jgi:RND family efflux transporter MFP subunit